MMGGQVGLFPEFFDHNQKDSPWKQAYCFNSGQFAMGDRNLSRDELTTMALPGVNAQTGLQKLVGTAALQAVLI